MIQIAEKLKYGNNHFKETRVICKVEDLVPDSGVCALVNEEQIAIFWMPEDNPGVYAIQNFDPIGGANVMSRGILGDINGEPVVASPLYKQHFSLVSGRCLENPEVSVRLYPVEIRGEEVVLLG